MLLDIAVLTQDGVVLLGHGVQRFLCRAFAADHVGAQLALRRLQQLAEDRDVPEVLHHGHRLGEGRVVDGYLQELRRFKHVPVAGVAAERAHSCWISGEANQRMKSLAASCRSGLT